METRFSFNFPIHSVKALHDWQIDANDNFAVLPDRIIAPTALRQFQDNFDGLATHIYEINPKQIITIQASPNLVTAGGEINYTVVFSNPETATISNVMVSSNIPYNTQFVSASNGRKQNNNQVVWGPFNLPEKQSINFTFEVKFLP